MLPIKTHLASTKQLKWILHVSFWLLITPLYYLTFLRVYPSWLSLMRTLSNILPMAGLFYFNLYLVKYYLKSKKYLEYFVLLIAIVLIMIYFRANINASFPKIDVKELMRSEVENWALGALIGNIGMISLSAFLGMLDHQYREEKYRVELIQEQQNAQLQFLRAQINPHFLFNTLNNIYYLAYTGSEQTADMVLKLSNLLRYVIYQGKEKLVSLKEEINHVKLFIELFQMRNEEPVDITFEVNDAIDPRLLIEPMILIPIVENCFKHCNYETDNQAFIRLHMAITKGYLHFTAINSKDDNDKQKDRVGGVGLENIKKRLQLKYEGDYKLKIKNDPHYFELYLSLKTIQP